MKGNDDNYIMLNKNILKKLSFIFLIILLLAYIPILTSFSIWYDESFSLNLVNNSVEKIIEGTANDVHPPLYYLILKLGMFFAHNEVERVIIGKVISFLSIVLIFVFNMTIVRKNWGYTVAWFHSFFILTMPRIMQGAGTEIRMYGWASLFVYFTLVFMLIYEKERKAKWLVFSTIFASASCYTHYFAGISAIMIYFIAIMIFLFRKDFKTIIFIIGSGVVVSLSYIPWLVVLLRQMQKVHDSYWIGTIGRSATIHLLEYPFGDNWLISEKIFFGLLVVSVIVIVIFMLISSSKKEMKIPLFSFGVMYGTMALGIFISRVYKPVIVPRYLLPSMVCFWFGISYSIKMIKKNWIARSVLIIMIATGLCNFYCIFPEEKASAENMKAFYAFLDSHEDATVIVSSDHLEGVINAINKSINVIRVDSEKEYENIDNTIYVLNKDDTIFSKEFLKNKKRIIEFKFEVYDVEIWEK